MRSPLIRAEHDGNIREYATDCLDAGPRAADDLYIYTADGEVRCRYGFNNGGTWTYDTQVLYRIVPTSHQPGHPNVDGYYLNTSSGGGAGGASTNPNDRPYTENEPTCHFAGWNTSHVVDGMQMPICSNYQSQNKFGPNADGTW